MATGTPPAVRKFCRSILPMLYRQANGRRILQSVKDIQATERWVSFDRFRETTAMLAREYEAAGAGSEIYPIQTGGRIGSGRWIVHEAADVRSAVVDIVAPVRRRLLDYAKNPLHVVQWSTSTPRAGMVSDLIVIDSFEQLDRAGRRELAGKMVLTRMHDRKFFRELANKQAAGVIVDKPVPNLPNATIWGKFGWGGIALDDVASRMVGLVLSENDGNRLRKLSAKHGRVTLRTKVDIRRYVGTHEMVSGLVLGRDDQPAELWALAHSTEPGAMDNCSGVAVCLEIARIIESLIADGTLQRPRRSIRLISGYECYSFFDYLENVRRQRVPLAGVCIDSVGAKPPVCDGRLEWHATIPSSAGFTDRVGEAILRSVLYMARPGYKLVSEPFVSTADTLIGDPTYGFPCPWITTCKKKNNKDYDAYHSSADTADLLSPAGLAACAAGMAGYLYYLADADSRDVLELAAMETAVALDQLRTARRRLSPGRSAYICRQHRVSLEGLKRWMWGGDRTAILRHLTECEDKVHRAGEKACRTHRRPRRRTVPGANRIPYRIAALSPTLENTPPAIARRIRESKLPAWALFWADGKRDLAQIAETVSCELKQQVTIEQAATFFEAHEKLEYVRLIDPKDMITRAGLVRDLKALGLKRGMDVMVHSSLGKIGHVVGGADTVVDALLAVIGKTGTLLMPSFNHSAAGPYNPMTTPTESGAIPEAMWRRPEAVRSMDPTHPVAAIGPKAESCCRDHDKIGIWAEDSPIGRLIHSGGYLLPLGVTNTTSTAYHVAEISVPCGCIDQLGETYRIVSPDGSIRQVRGLSFRSGRCPVPIEKMDKTLDRRKLQRHGTVGRADASLVKAIDLWRVRREHLKGACPTCPVKPRCRK